MTDEALMAKETDKSALLKPSLRAVPAPDDTHRTTKQMMEQFTKVKQGLKADLDKEIEERRRIAERIDDLELAIHVLSSAQAMLDTRDPS